MALPTQPPQTTEYRERAWRWTPAVWADLTRQAQRKEAMDQALTWCLRSGHECTGHQPDPGHGEMVAEGDHSMGEVDGG